MRTRTPRLILAARALRRITLARAAGRVSVAQWERWTARMHARGLLFPVELAHAQGVADTLEALPLARRIHMVDLLEDVWRLA